MCRNEFYARCFDVLALVYLIPNRKGSIIQYTVCTVEYYWKVSVQSSELGLPTSSPPSECVPPPWTQGGHTRLQGRGWGDPIPTTGQKLYSSTLQYILYIELVLYIVYSFTFPTIVRGGVVSLKGSHRMGFRQKSINRSSWWTVPLMLLLLYQFIIADHIL